MSEVDKIPKENEQVFTVSVTFLVFAILALITYRLFQGSALLSHGLISYMFTFVFGIAGAVLFCQNIRVTYDCSRLQFFWLAIMVSLVLLTVVPFVSIGSELGLFKKLSWEINFLLHTIWAPAVEEVFYRLFLLNVFQRMTGRNLDAILASSFLFMAVHITKYHADPVWLTIVFLASVLQGVLFLATRQLWPAIMFHFIFNYVEYIFTNTLNSSLGLYGWLLMPLLPILGILAIYTMIKLLRDNELLSARKFLAWLWNPTGPTTYRSVAAVLGLVSVIFTFQFTFPFLGTQLFYLLAWTGLPWFNLTYTASLALPIITLIVVFTFSLTFVALLVNTIQSWKTSKKSDPD